MTSRAWVLSGSHALACFCLVCACLSGPWLAPRAAQAQASSQPDAYKQLIEQALVEFRHKNWPEARVMFRRAHELSPNARTLRGMGVVSYEMRDYVQAVRDLDASLVDPRQPLTADQRAEAETLLSRARTFVAVYSVSLEPADATLALDGTAATREADGTLLLAFGEHTLSATAPGYEPARTQLTVQGGERGEVTLALVPVVAVAQAGAQPGDQPPTAGEPEPSAVPAREPAAPREGGLRYTWLALGTGAVFGAAGAVFWVLGDRKLDDLEGSCQTAAMQGTPCRAGNTNTDAIDRYELLTNVSLGLTGAALLASGVLAIVEWPRARERRLTVSAGPSSLSLRGAF